MLWADAAAIPDAIQRTLDSREGLGSVATFLRRPGTRRIIASGNGASFYVAMTMWLSYLGHGRGPEVVAIPAGLLASGRFVWRPGDVLLALSSSGEMNDLIHATSLLRTGPYAAITSTTSSTLGRGAAACAIVHATTQRSMTHTQSYGGAIVAALAILAELWGDKVLAEAVRRAPDLTRTAIVAAEPWAASVDLPSLPVAAITFGSGYAWAAALEAALLLKEVAGIPCEGAETREGATSAMYALTEHHLVLSIDTGDDPQIHEAEEICRSTGANLITIPGGTLGDERLSSVTTFPYMLALAVRLAVLAGRDVDRPEWAKTYLSAVRSGPGTR